MNKEFLERLYWACADESNVKADGTKLAEFYERIEEAENVSECFSKKVYALNLTVDEKDLLETIGGEFALVYEKQGFINGFRLGMKLARELGEEVAGA
ncbi:hypothetical protein AAEU42_10180 [Pseudoflavonifractor phocaeensis]|uniref:hypothetical protein n=1 Tax=Pseudoflavonifractor phocaeensis TaxID=1870988 RepID=UPI00313E764A